MLLCKNNYAVKFKRHGCFTAPAQVFSLLSLSVEPVSSWQWVETFPTLRSLINMASTESSETGSTSHTPCCKIMSLQWEGVTYKGGERDFLNPSPSSIYSNEMRMGSSHNWLDLSQKRGRKPIHFFPYCTYI